MQPMNSFVRPLLTDLYQLTMAYAYWKSGHHNDQAVFDLFFRKNPFGGEFTIFAGLQEALRFVSNFRITENDILYLKEGMRLSKEEMQKKFLEELEYGLIRQTPHGYERLNPEGIWEKTEYPEEPYYVKPIMKECDDAFFQWLQTLDCSKIKIYAVKEGTIVFPRIPLLRVEGPLAIAQLLETTLLTLINYPSLVATNAARFRLAAGPQKILLEFGLRRAQGPDGGLSASRYCYMGGFDATSNVLAGKLLGIPIRGTHAHSFVSTFLGLENIPSHILKGPDGQEYDFVEIVMGIREKLRFTNTNMGELTSFIVYAQCFPKSFLALVDTYDTLHSGVPNFLCVAIALSMIGYKPVGIRLDSGDLAYLSKESRKMFISAGAQYNLDLSRLTIVASNDINEDTLISLNQQGHEIDAFGIGTHLVTCQAQPALGGVYKLVELNGKNRIKLSQDESKITIPGKKDAYRIIGEKGYPLVDLLMASGEKPPCKGERILCRHPFEAAKRAFVTPIQVLPLHTNVWDGKFMVSSEPIEKIREYVLHQLNTFRCDHLRSLNPTPYKISLSDNLYNFLHNLWLEEAPVAILE